MRSAPVSIHQGMGYSADEFLPEGVVECNSVGQEGHHWYTRECLNPVAPFGL
jgi:hypothetical protein